MKKISLYFIVLTFVITLSCQQAYSAGIDPATIVGVWTLEDDVKGGEVKDLSPNGFNGQIKGTKQEDGKFGKCLDFAKGDTVTIDIGNGTITNKVTVVMWLKFTNLAEQQNYYSIWDQSDHRYVPYKTSANELHFWSNNWDVGSGTFVDAKKWYHVANIYNGSTVTIYVNGELGNSQAGAGFALSEQQQTSWLATDKGGWISACTIDDVGLFNAPLTEADVKEIMDKGIERALGYASVQAKGKLYSLWGELKTQ